MKRATKIILGIVVLVAAAGGAAAMISNNDDPQAGQIPAVEVTRGDIVDKALAVGTIVPRVEISVKSQFSGIVKRQYAEVGTFVRAGTPLLDVQPNPTPLELVDAERRIEMRQIELENLRTEHERQKQLLERQLISHQEFNRSEQLYEQSKLQVQMAREQLALLREGKVTTETGSFETVVRAPISGYILDRMVEVGDPVVPLTSYQEGTPLMTMADMDDLLFRGTVDEIDVGRLHEGMPARIKVGALPNAQVHGRLAKIWLKAQKEENSTVFPVEIEILEAVEHLSDIPESEPTPVVLRAGYSANSEIIIEQRDDVLLIPERVIEFTEDTASVRIRLADYSTEDRIIQTGLSDAINIEVISGLEEGEWVAEKPPKEIE
jgi:HlyD family secretion protein